jgi:bifunctional DNA-binding transcriptional regulator/antitoxin component of YhaV-PrlF toxin-antitoxin module
VSGYLERELSRGLGYRTASVQLEHRRPSDASSFDDQCAVSGFQWLCDGFDGLFLEENLYCGMMVCFMVQNVESGVEIKKVDAQGRLILPADWRETEVGESRELYVVKRKGYLKIVPKRRVDLTESFDKVDLGVEAIESWRQFEKKFYEVSR